MRLLPLCLIGALAGFGLARWTAPPKGVRMSGSPSTEIASPASTPAITPLAAPAGSMKTAGERLIDVLNGDDPLASAQRMIDLISHLTRDDFDELAKHPSTIPFPTFSGFDIEFRKAYFDALTERWFTLDPDNALRDLNSVCDRLRTGNENDMRTVEAEELLMATARVRPEAVLQGLLVDLQKQNRTGIVHEAFRALGARDPKAARRFLEGLSKPEARQSAEIQIANGIAQSDPLAAVAIGKRIKEKDVFREALAAAERIGPGIVSQVASAIGDDLFETWDLETLVLRHPGIVDGITNSPKAEKRNEYSSQQLVEEADRLSSEERKAALDRLGDLPPGTRDRLAAAIASSWARSEPKQAADWAIAHGKPTERSDPTNQAAQGVFLRWVNTEPEAAIGWWRSLPPSPLRDALGTNASTFIAEQGDLDTALALHRPQAGIEDDQATAQLVQMLAEQDPARAAEWLREIPDGVSVKDSSRTIVDTWYSRDPAAVAHWVESLPAGSRRDEATQAFIIQASVESPTGATEWVETIADPKLRQEAAQHVFWQMRAEDPAAAGKWIRSLQGVDQQWQERFLRRVQ